MDSFDLLLVADELREFLIAHGLDQPRVAGLLGSGRTLMKGMAAEIYIWPRQELTASDLARLSREASDVMGWPVVLWAVRVGEEDILPSERVTFL